ncbi:MAG: hypothetical protein ACRBBU_01630 [Pseudooceanicola sp.]
MRLKLLGFLPLVAALTACQSYSKIETPPVAATFTSETAKANAAKSQKIAIRAARVTKTANGKTTEELAGVRCNLNSTGFKASVVTPAFVTVPTYLGKTDPYTVTCKTGKETAQKTVTAINSTLQRSRSTYSSGGLVGALAAAAVTAAIRAARDPSKDQFEYPNQTIVAFDGAAAK